VVRIGAGINGMSTSERAKVATPPERLGRILEAFGHFGFSGNSRGVSSELPELVNQGQRLIWS